MQLARTTTEIDLSARATPLQTTPRHQLMPRDLATWNPCGCLVAIIEEPTPAAQAALALRGAGFGEADVCLVAPEQMAAIIEAQAARSRLAQAAAALRTLGDEGLVAAEYAVASRRGHQLLIVYAPRDERLRRALAVLTQHRAHTMHYFGRWIVRGL